MARDNIKDLADATLKQSHAMANAAGTADTDAIDLGDIAASRGWDIPDLVIETTEATAVDAHNTTFTVQDSADGSTGWAAVPGMPTFVVAAASSKYPAQKIHMKLSKSARRYIRLHDATDSGGGNATDGTMELSLRF